MVQGGLGTVMYNNVTRVKHWYKADQVQQCNSSDKAIGQGGVGRAMVHGDSGTAMVHSPLGMTRICRSFSSCHK